MTGVENQYWLLENNNKKGLEQCWNSHEAKNTLK